MRFASLGSGSDGNGLIVECGETRVLVDCGFKLTETIRRLARLGLEPSDLAAVLVTHEHDDHGGGVARLARRYDLPVYLTYGTLVALGPRSSMIPRVSVIDSHTPFLIGDLEIHPYPVPHDAREPSQFVFSDGDRRLGLLTDTGDSTPHIQRMLSGIDALVLECNHDLDLLMNGPYPPSLKRRISGRLGHLDNGTAARIVASIDCSRLQHFIAAHLSAQNNTPELARAAMSQALTCEPAWVCVATQNEGLDWRHIA
ncbi:MAG: MBL fold metallo-hydrolase [Burkholderiales bacterium]